MSSQWDILGEGRRQSNFEGALEGNFLKPKFNVNIARLVSPSLTSLMDFVTFGVCYVTPKCPQCTKIRILAISRGSSRTVVEFIQRDV